MRKSFSFKPVTRFPCLSVTVNTTFTSLMPTRILGTSAASAPELLDFCSAAGACGVATDCGDGEECPAGDGEEACGAVAACALLIRHITAGSSKPATHSRIACLGKICGLTMPLI